MTASAVVNAGRLVLVLVVACLASLLPAKDRNETHWQTIEPGLELGVFRAPQESPTGDSLIRVLRIDTARFELRLMNTSAQKEGKSLTAREWCTQHDLVAAINASMYQQDHRKSVSFMRTRTHVNNSYVSKDKAILAFDPLSPKVPPVKFINLECDTLEQWKPKYGSFVQSIRMISCEGGNVWSQQPRKWSTAAIGMDKQGRVLFIHVRSPYSTHDLIEMLQALPIGLVNAMYTEGGPEAQLFVRGGEQEHEFVGSYETGLFESGDNPKAWPVPNVIGVTRIAPAKD